MGFLSSLFGGKRNFKKTTASEDYPSRLAGLWQSDGNAQLAPQLWIRFLEARMAETVASLRPSSTEQYLAGIPEVIADADGTGVVMFPLREGSQIVSVIKELVPVLSGEGCGGKKPRLSGGVAVSLPPSRRKDLMYYVGGQAIEMGGVISW